MHASYGDYLVLAFYIDDYVAGEGAEPQSLRLFHSHGESTFFAKVKTFIFLNFVDGE